jgi:hypothetical protein
MSTVAEKIQIGCPSCGKKLTVPRSTAGKQGRCPACKHVFLIEAPAADVPLAAELVPMDDGALAPLSGDPFGAANSSDYTLQPAQPSAFYPNYATSSGGSPGTLPAQQTIPNPYAPSVTPAPASDSGGGWGMNAGIGGGLLLMLLAVVWFFGALFLADRIFFYPPIMFIIGLIAFFKGLVKAASG